jgi:hypothetical protein
MRMITFQWIVTLVVVSSCISTETKDGPLSKALAKAANEKRISTAKVNQIIQEYTAIDVRDPKVGQRYVNDIVKAVDAGTDSVGIDAIRKRYATVKKPQRMER